MENHINKFCSHRESNRILIGCSLSTTTLPLDYAFCTKATPPYFVTSKHDCPQNETVAAETCSPIYNDVEEGNWYNDTGLYAKCTML